RLDPWRGLLLQEVRAEPRDYCSARSVLRHPCRPRTALLQPDLPGLRGRPQAVCGSRDGQASPRGACSQLQRRIRPGDLCVPRPDPAACGRAAGQESSGQDVAPRGAGTAGGELSGTRAARRARPGRQLPLRIAKNAPISGAGDLISTTTDSSMASRPCRTPLGCRQTSPGPMMNSSEPTVDFTLPLTT